MKKRKEIDIVNGPMIPNIIRYVLPLIATGILQLLYNTADNIVVGRYEGETALAAVASNGSLISLITTIVIGLAVGSSVAAAQEFGAGNREGLQKVVHTSAVISMAGGIFVAVLGFIAAPYLLEIMQTPENVFPLSLLYLRIYFIGTPASMMYNFFSSILRSVGDTKNPLIFLTISGLVNVVLNLVFVLVFHQGVAGVAYATIISQFLSLILIVIHMMHLTDGCRLNWKKLRVDKECFIRILKVGIPAGLQSSVFALSNTVIQSSVNSFNSSTVMAGSSASGQIEGFVYIAMNAISHAGLTFTGQNIGAKKYDKLTKVLVNVTLIVTVVGVLLGVAVYTNGASLLKIYLPESPQAIEYGMIRMKYVALTYFLCGIMEGVVGCMRGMGVSVTPMIVSMLGACGSRLVWIGTVFKAYHTLDMLFISYPISWLITDIVHFIFYFYYKKKIVGKGMAFSKLEPKNE